MNAALNTGQSLLELAGSAVVLAVLPAPPQGRLAALGCVTLACAVLSAAVGAVSPFKSRFIIRLPCSQGLLICQQTVRAHSGRPLCQVKPALY